jgi:anti-anti-sigma factor
MVGGVTVLDVVPERTPEDVDAMRMGGALVGSGGTPRIVVDLCRLDSISSPLLAKLITLNKRIQRSGGELILCGLGQFVRETFASTKLDQLFDICEDEETALASP